MLLRAKIRSGEEDLSVFESQLLEDNGLQRAHSSPTLQDSSQASQASSTRDGGNSSKASGCSSKVRQEGQRHSYRQAVKKWDRAGAPGAARRCTASGRLSPCIGFYLRSRRVWSSAWRGEQEWGSTPHPPPTMTLYPAPQSSHLTEEVQILWLAEWLGNTSEDVGAGGGRGGWEVTDLQRWGVFENVHWVRWQTELCTEITRVLTDWTGTYIQHPFLFSPFCSFKAPLWPRSPTFFLDLLLSFWDQTCLHILEHHIFRRLMIWFQMNCYRCSDLSAVDSCWTCQTSSGLMEPLHSSSLIFATSTMVCSHSIQGPDITAFSSCVYFTEGSVEVSLWTVHSTWWRSVAGYDMMRRYSSAQLVSPPFSHHWWPVRGNSISRSSWYAATYSNCFSSERCLFFFFVCPTWTGDLFLSCFRFCPVMCFCSLSTSWPNVVFSSGSACLHPAPLLLGLLLLWGQRREQRRRSLGSF